MSENTGITEKKESMPSTEIIMPQEPPSFRAIDDAVDSEKELDHAAYGGIGNEAAIRHAGGHPETSCGPHAVNAMESVDAPGLEQRPQEAPPGEQGHENQSLDHDLEQDLTDVSPPAQEVLPKATAIDTEAEIQERLRKALGTVIRPIAIKKEEPFLSKLLPENRRFLLAAWVVAFLGLVVTLSVVFVSSGEEEGDFVEASVVHENLGGMGNPAAYANARRYRPRGSKDVISEGVFGEISCMALPCFQDSSNCSPEPKPYEHGCCLGPDCDPAEQCGHACPPFPESCRLIDPTVNCRSSECYTCDKGPDGKDVWRVYDNYSTVDCLATGTAMNGDQEYKWAIMCGPVQEHLGGEVKNTAPGEYDCMAFRKGGGLHAKQDGIESVSIPCQYVQLLECGCAPDDVHPWDLDPPTAPCKPGDCPFLCADAGKEHASKLCHAFGGIEWWEGENSMSVNLFWGHDIPEVFDIVINQDSSSDQK